MKTLIVDEQSRRRQRRSSGEWHEEIARWRRSGLSARAYAAERGLSPVTLAWWSKRVGRSGISKKVEPAFVPLHVHSPSARDEAPFAIEISLRNGWTLRASSSLDPQQLAAIVHALEGGRP
jgi:transposase